MDEWIAVEPLRYVPPAEVAFRLVAAAVLAGLIGLDREVRHKPVGLKTLMLVALGAAGFCATAMEVMARTDTGAGFAHAPDRVIQGVAVGIGFLGAGAIIQEGARVRGVTTGASLWVVGGIGVACGFGVYLHAVLLTIATLFVLVVLGALERRVLPSDRKRARHSSVEPDPPADPR